MDASIFDDPRKDTLLAWLTETPARRVPPTMTALAASLDVSARTLRDWKSKDEFVQEWERRARQIGGSPETLQQILEALATRALDPESRDGVQAARAWADMTGAIKPPSMNVNVSGKGRARDMTDEELDALLAAGAKSLLDERQALAP
jgi:AcrR family transcriptional regulator